MRRVRLWQVGVCQAPVRAGFDSALRAFKDSRRGLRVVQIRTNWFLPAGCALKGGASGALKMSILFCTQTGGQWLHLRVCTCTGNSPTRCRAYAKTAAGAPAHMAALSAITAKPYAARARIRAVQYVSSWLKCVTRPARPSPGRLAYGRCAADRPFRVRVRRPADARRLAPKMGQKKGEKIGFTSLLLR